jgi:hypothetical protein
MSSKIGWYWWAWRGSLQSSFGLGNVACAGGLQRDDVVELEVDTANYS